jgi:hypothetical protein
MNDEKEEAQGCLGAILGLLGIKLARSQPSEEATDERLPFALRDDFLSAAEYSFLRVLAHALSGRAAICPKVNLADIFFVARSPQRQRYHSMIDRKHVDFLLCDLTTMRPLCGIELDDSSHQREDRQRRDEFVNRVFAAAGLPLVRITARSGYVPAQLYAELAPYLTPASTPNAPSIPAAPVVAPQPVPQPILPSQAMQPQMPPTAAPGAPPICPKCGVPMVQRVASRGPNPGVFWGCPNFPHCRQTA